MSLVDPFPTIAIPSRKRHISNMVTEAAVKAAATMMIECGGVAEFGIAMKEQEEAVRANFRGATRRALQKVGVLDENFSVIPGQEEYAQCYSFGKER